MQYKNYFFVLGWDEYITALIKHLHYFQALISAQILTIIPPWVGVAAPLTYMCRQAPSAPPEHSFQFTALFRTNVAAQVLS